MCMPQFVSTTIFSSSQSHSSLASWRGYFVLAEGASSFGRAVQPLPVLHHSEPAPHARAGIHADDKRDAIVPPELTGVNLDRLRRYVGLRLRQTTHGERDKLPWRELVHAGSVRGVGRGPGSGRYRRSRLTTLTTTPRISSDVDGTMAGCQQRESIESVIGL